MKNFVLQHISVNGNADRFGGSNTVTTIAISSSKYKLQKFCKETYKKEASIGEPEKFDWEYFNIVETDIEVI